MSSQDSITASSYSLAAAVARLRAVAGPETARWRSLVAEVTLLPHVHCGAVIRASSIDRQAEIVALEPRLPPGTGLPDWLKRAITLTVDSKPDLSREPVNGESERSNRTTRELLVLPESRGDTSKLSLAVLTDELDEEQFDQLHAELQLLFYTCTASPVAVTIENASARPILDAVDILGALNDHTRAVSCAMTFCNELAARFDADRVSIGFVRRRFVRLFAQSHVERFVHRTAEVSRIEAAMEECIDQDIEVPFPSTDSRAIITRDAEELAKSTNASFVISLPLRRGGEVRGVVTVERKSERPLTETQVTAIRLACELAAPRLIDLHETDRWLGALAARSLRRTASTVLGPRYVGAKLLALAISAFIIFSLIVPGTARVTGHAEIAAKRVQVVSAPFAGMLAQSHVRVGDPVTAGETILAEMDASELMLQRAEAAASKSAAQIRAAAFRAQGRMSDAQIAEAEAAESQSRIELLDSMISKSTIRAAESGIVLSGDLSPLIGTTVPSGAELFRVGDPNDVTLEINVDESLVRELSVGQHGAFAPVSNPSERISLEITFISPVAEVIDGQNVFVVHAELQETPPWLAPGIEGIAKIDVGRRPYAAIWLRDLIDWMHLRLWW